MKKIIIFGDRDAAQLADYYLTHDSKKEVIGFCVDEKYKQKDFFCGKPVLTFEETCFKYPPKYIDFFAPIYESNSLRKEISNKIKNQGYNLISYISSKAYIWNSTIGENCFILEGANIQPFCHVGNNVIIWSFSHVGHHSIIKDNTFISGNVVIAGHNVIEENCFLGTNCTTRDRIKIPKNTTIGQDASIVKNLEIEGKTWVGVPAKVLK